MRASLDTNVIIHLYHAGKQEILFQRFKDGLYIYAQIRNIELVNHGHILVNGEKVNIPSFNVKPGSTISVLERSINHPAIKAALENTLNRASFVEFDSKKMSGTYIRLPERSELNADINESLIVEFYNR